MQEQHIDHYNVTVNVNNTHDEFSTTNTTNITLHSLTIGTNYSFIIIPFNNCGDGSLSSLIQYIWNGKSYRYTHTHTLHTCSHTHTHTITHCISYNSTSSSC